MFTVLILYGVAPLCIIDFCPSSSLWNNYTVLEVDVASALDISHVLQVSYRLDHLPYMLKCLEKSLQVINAVYIDKTELQSVNLARTGA